ncbi:MAG: phage tail sheath C-terminal domain-containing protein [Bacteroidota bacterium]
MAQEKTPGVYIREVNAFPNSVVEVATAIPAFIGHTEKATFGNRNLLNEPVRLTSFAEFTSMYGGPPLVQYDFVTDPTPFDLNVDGTTEYNLYYGMRMFFANGGGPCYIVSVGSYSDKIDKDTIIAALEPLKKEQEPTMIVVPDATLLGKGEAELDAGAQPSADIYNAVLGHCAAMQSRIGIFDIFNGDQARNPAGDPVNVFREKVTSDFLNYGTVYYPWINTSILSESDVSFVNIKDPSVLATALDAEIDTLFPALPDGSDNPRAASFKSDYSGKMKEIADAYLKAVTDGDNAGIMAAKTQIKTVHQAAYEVSPMYKAVVKLLLKKINLMPPAAAMAGVYTRIDNTQGVFKAPANTGINNVVSPAVSINHEEQEDLNVPLNGKAVNAIRFFPGRGVLIWGARTLDGNSQDWRYISVRRTMIMLEQSIKIASEAFVFEANNAKTWGTMKAMIENFLTNKWKEGALVGATSPEAFEVFVGLGSTMTANDILDGYMRITVKVAVVRPAEFIVITFQQKMQTS